MKIRFVSGNEYKLAEASRILSSAGITVSPFKLNIDELQTEDTARLVKDKTMKAFRQVGRPLFVEHTGLYLDVLNGFPGGLTQIFWDRLGEDRFAELFGGGSDGTVRATTVIWYTDGRKIFQFNGSVDGRIAPEPRGPRGFQWDCVFIPAGHQETFAELGEEKNQISMRRLALDEFADFLTHPA